MRFLSPSDGFYSPNGSNTSQLLGLDTVAANMLDQTGVPKVWRAFALMATIVLILFTVCGNAMTLFAVCKMKTFQNSISNLYIASLAAADLVVGAFVMTFMMLYKIAYDGVWVFGPVMCDVWQAVDFISCTVSLYSICAIGFDRWLNLEKPLRVFKRNRNIAKRAMIAVWLLPVLVWTPMMVVLRLRNGRASSTTCTFAWRPAYVVPAVAAPFFYAPVLMLMVLFVRISLVIRSHLQFLHTHSNQQMPSLLGDHMVDRSPSGFTTPMTPRKRRQSGASNGTTGVRTPTFLPLNGHAANGQFYIGDSALCSRQTKCKPPPLSPIVSVILNNNFPANPKLQLDGNTITDSSMGNAINVSPRPPNQSPLAMKVLRERISPKIFQESKKQTQSIESDHSFVQFSFDQTQSMSRSDSRMSDRDSLKSQKIDMNDVRTPLLRPGQKRSLKNRRSTLAEAPGMFERLQFNSHKRSASRESVDGPSGASGSRSVSQNDQDTPNRSPSPKPVGINTKRSSVTSDTAVFFTKRFLTKKPPLLRAKTECILEVTRNGAVTRPRPSGRFSIISMNSPFFTRKYSMNIFSDMLPNAGGLSQQIRAAKAVGVILFFFLVCWTPFLVLWPLKTYCNECVSTRLYELASWANYLNSTLNPILYTLCSPRFQRLFKKYCHRPLQWCKRTDDKKTLLTKSKLNFRSKN